MKTQIKPLGQEFVGDCGTMMAETNSAGLFSLTGEQYGSLLRSDSVCLNGAFIGENLVGFLAAKAKGFMNEPLLDYVCVKGSARGFGVGSDLINFFEEELFPDAPNLYLFVSDENLAARRLYERLGYKPFSSSICDTEFLYRKARQDGRS